MIQKTKKSRRLQMGNRNNIQSLQGGQDEKISIAHFLLICQEKKGKKQSNQFVFEGQMEGSNLQHTTTMHKWGQVQKREKSFYWHTSWQLQTKLHVFPSSFTPP
jgi:hypothetical protein